MHYICSTIAHEPRTNHHHPFRVKLPKSFLAVNLSDAFTFQEKQAGDVDAQDSKDGLEMKSVDKAAKKAAAAAAVEDAAHKETKA